MLISSENTIQVNRIVNIKGVIQSVLHRNKILSLEEKNFQAFCYPDGFFIFCLIKHKI